MTYGASAAPTRRLSRHALLRMLRSAPGTPLPFDRTAEITSVAGGEGDLRRSLIQLEFWSVRDPQRPSLIFWGRLRWIVNVRRAWNYSGNPALRSPSK